VQPRCETILNANQEYRPEEKKRLLWCIGITGFMMVAEILGGLWTGSLALLSDAGHMFSHLFSLFVSYGAIWLVTRGPDEQRSFGFYRAEILAALFNGITLIVIVIAIFYAAIQRFFNPSEIATTEMMWIAIAGLIVNLTTAWILKKVSQEDINVRSAFLHMLGDTASSVGVIVVAWMIQKTGKTWLDPVASILIAIVIAIWSIGLIRDSIHILLEAAPKHLSSNEICKVLRETIPQILEVHHVHIWTLTSGICSLTAHIVLEDLPLRKTEEIRTSINKLLSERFQICHTNLQFECKE